MVSRHCACEGRSCLLQSACANFPSYRFALEWNGCLANRSHNIDISNFGGKSNYVIASCVVFACSVRSAVHTEVATSQVLAQHGLHLKVNYCSAELDAVKRKNLLARKDFNRSMCLGTLWAYAKGRQHGTTRLLHQWQCHAQIFCVAVSLVLMLPH